MAIARRVSKFSVFYRDSQQINFSLRLEDRSLLMNQTRGNPVTIEAIKKVVRRFNVEVIEAGRRTSFDELMDPNFINRSAPPTTPDGPESMWNTFENVLRPALCDLRVEILEQLCEGDKVVTHKRVSGQHVGMLLGVPPTGRSVTIEIMDIVRVRDGRYVEHWGVNTLPAVLNQLRS